MKEIILSADGDSTVWSVPDPVADGLAAYCLEFCDHWLKESPDAAPYRQSGGLCYTEADFIDWLNRFVFPDEPSVLIRNLGWTGAPNGMPEAYAGHPYFNF